jgi:hypothetical protein
MFHPYQRGATLSAELNETHRLVKQFRTISATLSAAAADSRQRVAESKAALAAATEQLRDSTPQPRQTGASGTSSWLW